MKYSENYLQEFFGNLTPSELDELTPAGFDAKAPRGALKRIEKSAVEKAGVRPAKRKRYFKPLMIAAAVFAALAATLFTVNASGGNIVKFFAGNEEVEGDYRDYVDHDGYRHVRFEAVVPIDFENYAMRIDVDEPDPEKAVQVLTEENAPELFEKIAEYHFLWNKTYKERNKLKEAGVPEDELPKYPDHPNLDNDYFGMKLTDSQIVSYNWKGHYIDENGMEWTVGGAGIFGEEGWSNDHKSGSYTNRHEEEGTKTIGVEVISYIGLD